MEATFGPGAFVGSNLPFCFYHSLKKKFESSNPNIFASSSVRSVSRTDHGADDECDAAVEVDGALQLVVLVHAGRHLPSVRPSPSPESQPLYV